MRAFILAAGLGTRLQPLTNTKPKALVEVNEKTLLEITIQRLISFGFHEIIVNVHHFGDQIIDFLKSKNNFGIKIHISDERDLLLDTGGGLKNTSWFFDNDKPFLVHNVDILSELDLETLYNFHLTSGSITTLAVQNRNSSRYFLFDTEKNLCGWQNVKTNETKMAREPVGDLSQFAFSGIHIADPQIFSLMPSSKVFSIVDFYLAIASVRRITYFDHSGSRFLDLGKKDNLLEAEKLIS
jgi:NDP-sugar pyrophosphorylase family protein